MSPWLTWFLGFSQEGRPGTREPRKLPFFPWATGFLASFFCSLASCAAAGGLAGAGAGGRGLAVAGGATDGVKKLGGAWDMVIQ